ncbi:MAG: DNA primase [Deltaproteobacteria bacterium]|nr:DNA primase [Deltaproteobacteria bacterium]
MAHGIPPEKIAEVRARVDIGRVIGRSVELKKQGRRLTGRCPFHDDKTPSFSVDPTLKLYHCFGCGVGGDVFDFVMRREGVEFPEAVRQLAKELGVDLPERPESKEERERRSKKAQLLRVNQIARDYYSAMLLKDSRAKEYLAERGLSSATIERFGLGFAPAGYENLSRELAAKSVPVELSVELGLLGNRQSGGVYDRIRGRIVFPILAPGGDVVGFGARRADWIEAGPDAPKYLNSPESPIYEKSAVFYGLDVAREHIRRSGSAVLVEGYMDVLALQQAGIANAIAACGTALSQKHSEILAKLAKRVVTLYDADPAGFAATKRSAEILLGAGLEVVVARLPNGEDPDTFVLKHGAEAMQQVLKSAPSAIDAFVDEARKAHSGEGIAGASKTVSEVRPFLEAIKDPLLRDVAMDAAARKLGLEPQILRRNLSDPSPSHGERAPVERRPPKEPLPTALETEILRHALIDPSGTIAEVDRFGATDAIEHPAIQTGLAMVRIALRDGRALDAGSVLETLAVSTPGAAAHLRETLINAPPEPTILTDCLLKLLEKYRDAELRRIARAVGTGIADAETIARIERLNDRIRELSPARGRSRHG